MTGRVRRELRAELQVSPDSAVQSVVIPLDDAQDAVPEVLVDPGRGHLGTWRRQAAIDGRPPRYVRTL